MSISDLYKKLDYWEYDYCVPKEILADFTILKDKLGITKFYKYDNGDYWSYIYIKEYLKVHPFAYTSVLWHEFCHAEVWVRYGYTDGHSTAWVKRMLRKPWYVIGCIYAQIICIGK